jgi:hypothetical protein
MVQSVTDGIAMAEIKPRIQPSSPIKDETGQVFDERMMMVLTGMIQSL